MKKIVLTGSLAFSGFLSFTQPASSEKSESIVFFYCDEIPAEYPGGQTAIIKLFTDSMQYPMPFS